MTTHKYEITDSDGVQWSVTVSGPIHAGSAQPGYDVTKLPEMWFARYQRLRREKEIVIDLGAEETDPAELRAVLERDSEWQDDRKRGV